MPIDIKKGFDDQDYLWDIRRNLLNPITKKVATLEDKMSVVEPLAKAAFTHLEVKTDEQKVIFSNDGGDYDMDLRGMFREGSDLTVQGATGPGIQKVTNLKFTDATLKSGSTGLAEVTYDWPKLVGDNQKDLQVGTIAEGNRAVKYLFFKGGTVTHTAGDIATVTIPESTAGMTAAIPGKGQTTPVKISHIELEGEVESSVLETGKLTIHMNKSGGGGVAPIAEDNFKGFFESFGDLEDEVKDPKNGKSYAFVRDTQLGGKYYTPHFYIADSWKEFKQDPALTYSGPLDPKTHGVFSIKPSERILIDDNGQLNLDGLSTPQDPQYFHGFFDTLSELRATITNPIINKSLAYVRHANGAWIGYQWRMFGSTYDWRVMAPIAALSMVDNKTSSTIPDPFYGIYRNEQWELDTNGIATLKPVNTKTKIAIIDAEGNADQGEVDTIQFMAGKSYAALQGTNKDRLFLNHPQRVITYTGDFEADHNKKDYEGNIFYDENSRAWVGWGIPKTASGVDNKWTRIAHPHMSDEVKDLVKRIPAKSPSVSIGILQDSRLWDYNGVTYVEKGEASLPDEFRDICGGYFTTSVLDKDAAGVTIPQYRMQTCTADQEGGETYSRRFLSSGSPGASTYWSPWVRTSFSKKDINAHENDPSAHKNVIKYHKLTSFTAKFSDFLSQIGPEGIAATGTGTVRGDNCGLLVDNYGYTEGADYLEIPYDGSFKIKGELALSGYEGTTYPVCEWIVTLVLARKNHPTDYGLLKQFKYVHSDSKKKYPPIFFYLPSTNLEVGDKVYIKIKCSDSNAVKITHPSLYFVPVKSYFMVEDVKSFSGGRIANAYRDYMSNLNTFGDLEVKAHFPKYANSGTVRVYGDSVIKQAVEMK